MSFGLTNDPVAYGFPKLGISRIIGLPCDNVHILNLDYSKEEHYLSCFGGP